MIELLTMFVFLLFSGLNSILAARNFVKLSELPEHVVDGRIPLIAGIVFNLSMVLFTTLASVGLFLQAMALAS